MEFVNIVACGKRTPEQQLLKLYKTITSMIKKKNDLYQLKYNSIWMAGLLRSTRLTLETNTSNYSNKYSNK